MELIKTFSENTGRSENKFFKTTLFQSDALLIGVNCLEPGQIQRPHEHAGQDKFYYIVEGSGRFYLGEEQIIASAGQVVLAPAGLAHGVENDGAKRLSLLVGIAPAP